MGSTRKPRLLLIGIDGADFGITDWLLKRGDLPNLAKLAAGGAWGPLRSTVPPVTPAAWTTLMTGKNPGKHGVFDFAPMDGTDPHVPIALRRRAMTVWRALSDRGYKVGTFNLPATYPPEPLSAFQVSGFTAPEFGPAAASPARAFELLRDSAFRHGPFGPAGHDGGMNPKSLRERAKAVVAATRQLLQAFPCDVYMTNFQVVDWVQHAALAGEMTPGAAATLDTQGRVAAIYREVDRRVGELLREWAGPDTTVMVVSDHGAAVVDHLVNMEKLFADHGLLAYTSASTGDPSVVEARRSRARRAVHLWSALRRLLPTLSCLLRPLARSLRSRVASYQADLKVDWARTRAAPWGLYGQVRLNLAGRDAEGIVPPGSEARLKAEIRSLIGSLTDSGSGLPVFGDVPSASEIYAGPFVGDGPDLVALPQQDRYMTVCGRMMGEKGPALVDVQEEVKTPLEQPRGFHSPLGILFMAGPGVREGRALCEAALVDFAPTVLWLLGEPIPRDMDGFPLLQALKPAAVQGRPMRFGQPWPSPRAPQDAVYTQHELELVEERLQAIGYL